MGERAQHYLVVTLDAGGMEPGHEWDERHRTEGCDECNTDPFNLTIECPGIEAGRCEAWVECLPCREALAKIDDEGARDDYIDGADFGGVVHGEAHQVIDGEPCVSGGTCYLIEASGWDMPESAWDIARDRGPGRWPIDWDGGGFNELNVIDMTEEVSA